MNDVTVIREGALAPRAALPAMTPGALAYAREAEAIVAAKPQIPIVTDHLLHGGLYVRTIMIPAGTVLTGALIRIPTVLILNGKAAVFIGDGYLELEGYHVLPASAGRKQVFKAHADTHLTMLFPYAGSDIEEAERLFTDEFDLLGSHRDVTLNRILITGE